MGKRRHHAVVFETAGGVEPLVLEVQLTAAEAHVLSHPIRPLQQRPPFADGDQLIPLGKGQKPVKSPHATEGFRLAWDRGGVEFRQGGRQGEPAPVVGHVEEVPAFAALHPHVLDAIRGAAGGENATLKGDVHPGRNANIRRLQK